MRDRNFKLTDKEVYTLACKSVEGSWPGNPSNDLSIKRAIDSADRAWELILELKARLKSELKRR